MSVSAKIAPDITTALIIFDNSKYDYSNTQVAMSELEPCPFCGNPPEARIVGMYSDKGYQVRCPRCHVATSPVVEGFYNQYHGKQNVSFTKEQALREAIRIWNTRTTHDPVTTRYNGHETDLEG